MLLYAGRKYVKRKDYKNLISAVILFVWAVVGFFTIKRRTYRAINQGALKRELATNGTSFPFMEKSVSEIYNFLWKLEINYLDTDKFAESEPKRDFLLIMNIFMGVEDDIDNKDSWFVVVYCFIGYCVFGWNVIRFLLWFDKKVDLWLDDRKYYDDVGDEDINRDLVLEYRRQMREKERTGKPIEIKTSHFPQYDTSRVFEYMGPVFLTPMKSVSPSFLYPALHAVSLFVLAGIHTWIVEPNLFVDNLVPVTSFVAGIDSSMFLVNKNGTNFLLYGIGFISHVFLCGSMWRLSQLVVVVYQYMIGVEDTNVPRFLSPIVEDTNVAAETVDDHRKAD